MGLRLNSVGIGVVGGWDDIFLGGFIEELSLSVES